MGLKRLSDAPELRLANICFALNDSTVMKLSSKGSCVAVLRSPALSLEPEQTEDMALQTVSEFFPGGSADRKGSASPLDAAIPHRKKVAPCLVDMSSEQLKFGCSAEIVVSTSAL